MVEDGYNLKNPAVKRILQEMQVNPSNDFMGLPLEVLVGSIRFYHTLAGSEINQLQWLAAQPDWIAFASASKMQLLKV